MKFHQYFVYLLKCNDNTYYAGVTNDINRRYIEHQNGDDVNSYTFKRRPVELVFVAEFSDINAAIEKEKQIKKWSKAKKEALILENYELLPELSKKKFKK
ncbi:MAG: GIY-YIG nuclease family protein [Flavobacteriales bacterium]